ncbi:unnamed protein product, partial [Musa acuminata subsp. malaccensis]
LVVAAAVRRLLPPCSATPKSYRNEQLAHPRRPSRRSLRAQDVADLLRLLLLRRRHPIPAHRARPVHPQPLVDATAVEPMPARHLPHHRRRRLLLRSRLPADVARQLVQTHGALLVRVLLARLHNPHGTPAAASPGGCNSDSRAGSPWKMTIPRVSGLSMTTRSSSGVSPSAGPVRTTPKTMGKRAVPRRSSPSSAPPALRRSPS